MVPLERVVCYANFSSLSALFTRMRPETRFTDRGMQTLKGVPGERRLYVAQS